MVDPSSTSISLNDLKPDGGAFFSDFASRATLDWPLKYGTTMTAAFPRPAEDGLDSPARGFAYVTACFG